MIRWLSIAWWGSATLFYTLWSGCSPGRCIKTNPIFCLVYPEQYGDNILATFCQCFAVTRVYKYCKESHNFQNAYVFFWQQIQCGNRHSSTRSSRKRLTRYPNTNRNAIACSVSRNQLGFELCKDPNKRATTPTTLIARQTRFRAL